MTSAVIHVGQVINLPPDCPAPALTAIAAGPLRIAGEPELQEGLVVYYSFDRIDGDRVPDESGAGNYGLIWERDKPAPIVHGRFGGAYDFDHSAIGVTNDPTSGLRAFTVSTWFKTDSLAEDATIASAAVFTGDSKWTGWSGWMITTAITSPSAQTGLW